MSSALNLLTAPILIVIIIALVLALGYLLLTRQFSNNKSSHLPNSPLAVKAKPLMSNAERTFFHLLQNAFQNRYEIFPQVSLESVVARTGDLPPNVWGMLRNSRADFVLAHPQYLDTVLVIELDDSSHEQATARTRDEIKDRILKDAKIPLLRFRVGDKWDVNTLRLQVNQAIQVKSDQNA